MANFTINQATFYSEKTALSENAIKKSIFLLPGLLKRATNRYSNIFLGLYGAVVKNPEIIEIVVDMLLAHLNIYLETDVDVLPPVKFELCVDQRGAEVVLQEPIAEMIFALQKIYIHTIPKRSNTLDKLRDVLESLCTRMASTELEHLNLVIETLIPKVLIKCSLLVDGFRSTG